MLINTTLKRFCFSTVLLGTTMLAAPALAEMDADTAKKIDMMQQQIEALQKELTEVKKNAATATKTAAAATAVAKNTAAKVDATPLKIKADKTAVADAKSEESGMTLTNKNKIKLTLGGFIEAAGIYRNHNETSDIASSFSGIPYPISHSAHMSEFRGTSRQSRLSLLAEGNEDATTKLSAYFEGDFLGAAPTANSNESNSYNPRIRQIYATADYTDTGLHLLGGQAWSLVTLNKVGITPRQENTPLTIEAQYVPGFTWTRNTQFRVAQEFDDSKIWAGISVESPQALVSCNSTSGSFCSSLTYSNSGGSGYASTSNYSTDLAPDIVAKVAADPGYGHYELFGLTRFFRDRNNNTATNNTVVGGGVGAGAILPIIHKKLDFQLSGLIGKGVGRYGSVQLPDITFKSNGDIATLPGYMLLAGLVGHPDEKWDVYLYGGMEGVGKEAFTSGGTGYGYGNGLFNNSGCETEGSAASTCVANTSRVSQVTAGTWWKFYKGNFGTMQAGLQDSYTHREIFSGVGGSPSANENISMVSFRYYPF